MKNYEKKALKVGFDLDGVILYNPIRITRPIIAFLKAIFFNHKKPLTFYYPKSKLEKFFWRLFHLSSFFAAPGIEKIEKLVKEKKIKAYLITARYYFLKNNLDYWIKKIKLKKIFHGIYFNQLDEQPHLFKEKMIKKLNIDIFIEDNWDIVSYLNQIKKSKNKKILKTRIFWIYNLFDRRIKYKYKYPSLTSAMRKINKLRL